MTATAEQTTTTETTNQGAQAEETKASAVRKVNSTAQKLVGTRYATFIGPKGTFQPGHDAKAKSQMIRDAVQTEDAQLAQDAEAAINLMGWGNFLTAKRAATAKGATPRERKPKAEKAAAGEGGAATTSGGAAPAKAKSADDTLAGFHTRRGKSGFFVMNGPEQGVVKYNTQAEADEVVGYLDTGAVTVDQVKSAENLEAIRAIAATAAEGATSGEAEPGETASDNA